MASAWWWSRESEASDRSRFTDAGSRGSICCGARPRFVGEAAAQLDQTAGGIRVAWDEPGEFRVGGDDVKQAARDAAVKCADGRLVLAYGITVGAIAQSIRQPSGGIDLATRLKAKRDESGVHALLGRAGLDRVLGTEVASDLPSGRLNGAQAGPAAGDGSCQPAAQVGVPGRWLSVWLCVRRDEPHVARSPWALSSALARHETGFAEALEMQAHAVGMQAEPFGQLLGAGGPAEIAQEREKPCTGRLRERVVES
jgi:hypothetical protein